VDIQGTGHIVVINTPGSTPSRSDPPVSVNISVTHSPITTIVISDDEEDLELRRSRSSRVRPCRPISISSDEGDSSNVEGASGSEIEPINLYFTRNCVV